MSQCLRNLLDRHQKTGMEAAHVSLTKRRKSPAPDVQLIQPQRQEQTPATKKRTKAEKSTCPPAPKKEKVCWADPSILFDLTKRQSSTEMQKKESVCSLHFQPLGPHRSDPQLMTKMPTQQHNCCRSPLLFHHIPSVPPSAPTTCTNHRSLTWASL